MPKEEGVTASSHSCWGNLSDRVTEHSLGFGDVGLYWYSIAILGKKSSTTAALRERDGAMRSVEPSLPC